MDQKEYKKELKSLKIDCKDAVELQEFVNDLIGNNLFDKYVDKLLPSFEENISKESSGYGNGHCFFAIQGKKNDILEELLRYGVDIDGIIDSFKYDKVTGFATFNTSHKYLDYALDTMRLISKDLASRVYCEDCWNADNRLYAFDKGETYDLTGKFKPYFGEIGIEDADCIRLSMSFKDEYGYIFFTSDTVYDNDTIIKEWLRYCPELAENEEVKQFMQDLKEQEKVEIEIEH